MGTQTGKAESALGKRAGGSADGAADPGYSMSNGLVARLRALDIGLAVTSYQSGLLYMLGRNPGTGGLNVHQTPILRPMRQPSSGFRSGLSSTMPPSSRPIRRMASSSTRPAPTICTAEKRSC